MRVAQLRGGVPFSALRLNGPPRPADARPAPPSFDVPAEHHLIKGIGQGAYGTVCSALDSKRQRHVAIKKITKCVG